MFEEVFDSCLYEEERKTCINTVSIKKRVILYLISFVEYNKRSLIPLLGRILKVLSILIHNIPICNKVNLLINRIQSHDQQLDQGA